MERIQSYLATGVSTTCPRSGKMLQFDSDSSVEYIETFAPNKMSSNPPTMAQKRRRVAIAPATTQRYSSYDLFGTDSEDDDEIRNDRTTKTDKYSANVKNKLSTSTCSSLERELKKVTSYNSRSVRVPQERASTSAAPDTRQMSTSDVSDSDSDEEPRNMPKLRKRSNEPLYSCFSKRVPCGVLRQSTTEKEGTHYIELKVYKSDEIKHVPPNNRSRHALIKIKNKSNADTEAWDHLSQFIKATRQEFNDCRADIISGFE